MEDLVTITQPESFTIQELSQQSGLNESTLRYYEKVGLLKPVPRDPRSGHRRYPAETGRVVTVLACLRTCGFSIEDMRTYLHLLEKGGPQGATLQKELLTTHAQELERHIERLQIRKQYLEIKATYWEALERGDTRAAQLITEEIHRLAARLTERMKGKRMERVTTPFGAKSTAEEVVQGVDLAGKRVIVTGGASGIGRETARVLAKIGADVTLAVRNIEAGEQAATDMIATTGNPQIHVAALDLSNLASVDAFVKGWEGPLHILVNNAGIMAVPELELTPEGHELQFATNFLGHFALTIGLHASLAAASGARIVSVSSSGHHRSPVIFDDLDFLIRPYDPISAYGQSKTACILLAVEATRRWSNESISANALNPGAIATNLQKYTGGLQTPVEKRKTPSQGAATSVLLAVSPLLEGIGGRYFEDCNESPVLHEKPVMFGGGVAPWALDPCNAERLWEVSLCMLS